MGAGNIRHQLRCCEDVPNWKRTSRTSNQSRCRRRSRPTEREREPTGIALPCQLERTHVHVHELAFQWDCVLPCSESMGCISCAKERYCAERIRPTHARMGGQLKTLVSRGKVHRSRRSFKRGADQTSSRCTNRGRWHVVPTNMLSEAESREKRCSCGSARPTASQPHRPCASLRELQRTRA